MNTLAVIKAAQAGDNSARDDLFNENTGLVWSVVRRFFNRGVEADDLFQIGSIGLLKAIDNFNPDFNVQFSTYAVPMIMGEIKKFIRDDGTIKVSRSLKELSMHARAVEENLRKVLGRDPTIGEVSAALGVTPEDLTLAMEASMPIQSIYQTVNDGDSLLLDYIKAAPDCEKQVLTTLSLKQAIDSLGEREQRIVILRYFKNKTQTEIAKMLGISQVQVSRIEKKLLSKLREKIS